ncbi:TPA: hypothetical protein DEP94_03120 [Candidatus Nomurabacteria bacterium]|nr:hypothetical protein [Candidatus Nomurabacteria bacterium]
MSELFLPLHFLVLAFVAWNVFHADHLGFSWIRGKVAMLDTTTVKKYHNRTWIGLILMILTGLVLFWPTREYLFTRPQFFIKMGFVVALFINSFVIGLLSKISTTKTYASLTFSQKLPLIISGGVSTISWLGATVMALFLEQE